MTNFWLIYWGLTLLGLILVLYGWWNMKFDSESDQEGFLIVGLPLAFMPPILILVFYGLITGLTAFKRKFKND